MSELLEKKWQDWIHDNFLRNCRKEDMLTIMTKAGISKEIALFNLNNYESNHEKDTNNQLIVDSSAGSWITKTAAEKTFQQEASYLFQHENILETSDGQRIHISMRYEAPDIVLLDHFMTHEECDTLRELSKGTLTKSEVVDDATGSAVAHADRSSQGTFFRLGENPLVEKIEARISEITDQPVINGEGIQILNYINGGEYKPHFDYFPDNEGGNSNMAQGGQRIITIIMYLNDVEAGGATIFPEINLSVFPKKGSAIYFSYFNSLGQTDPLTLHGGAPVTKGEKWIATKWIRKNAYV